MAVSPQRSICPPTHGALLRPVAAEAYVKACTAETHPLHRQHPAWKAPLGGLQACPITPAAYTSQKTHTLSLQPAQRGPECAARLRPRPHALSPPNPCYLATAVAAQAHTQQAHASAHLHALCAGQTVAGVQRQQAAHERLRVRRQLARVLALQRLRA